MVRCGKCRFCYQIKNKSWCDYIEDYVRDDSSCEHGEFPENYSEKQTNYRRIVSKSPEALAEFFCDDYGCPIGRGYPDCGETPTEPVCFGCWLDWLRQEAK
ncbi:MAG: hypothetical protein J6S60_07205 [Oscillospiraceae bacterium]|nr:hypothetical protein [Oscillospiraceae bacterium]